MVLTSNDEQSELMQKVVNLVSICFDLDLMGEVIAKNQTRLDDLESRIARIERDRR